VIESRSRTRSRWIFGGIVCGALFVWAVQPSARRAAEDEERPPIIVKGGSLLIESGDAAKGKKGKPWKKEAVADGSGKNENQWKPDHPTGIPSSILKVVFFGGKDDAGRACAAMFLPEFTVLYDPDGTGALPQTSYLVTRRPRERGQGTLAPAVIETGLPLTPGGTADYPALMAAGTNKAFRIEYTKADPNNSKGWCERPSRVEVSAAR
jgi:hypothetical protein